MSWIIALIVIFSLIDRLQVFENNEKDKKESETKSNRENLEKNPQPIKSEDKKEKEKNWIEKLYDISLEEDANESLKEAYETAKKNWTKFSSSKSPEEKELKEVQEEEVKEPKLSSEKRKIRDFSDLFPDSFYTLEDIHRIEKDLTEEEFVYYREDIYQLEEEILKNKPIKEETPLEKGEIKPNLSNLQEMVILKEILDPPVSKRS